LKERLLRSFDSLDFAPHFALNGRASQGKQDRRADDA
jgi:hypothetical protein